MNLKFLSFTKENYFYQISNDWLEYKKPNIKLSTYSRYSFILKHYILPEYGNLSIRNLKKINYNQILQKHKCLSVSTANQILSILKSILAYSNKKYGTNINISLISNLKSNKNKEMKVFNNNEIELLKNYCLNDTANKSLGILLSISCGLRIGEISALKWKNIDFKNNKIYIENTLERIQLNNHTKVILSSPKSNNSIRKIPMNKILKNKLLSIYEINKPSLNAYVLTNKEDSFIEPRCLTNRYKKVLKELNLPDYKFHILRHTFATKCVQINMNPKLLSLLLGHSNVNITLNTYVHPSIDEALIYLDRI